MANTRARLALRLVGRSRPCAATIFGMAAYAVLARTQAMADWVHVAAVLLIAALTVAGAALAQKKRLLAELRQLRPPRDAADA